MNALEIADELDGRLDHQAANMLRQQQEQINNLQQWERRQLDVVEAQKAEIEALKNLVAEQDKKIIELSFRVVYAERSNEIVKELSK